MACRHARIEVDTDLGWYSCRDCWEVLPAAQARTILAGSPLLRLVPDLPELPDRLDDAILAGLARATGRSGTFP